MRAARARAACEDRAVGRRAAVALAVAIALGLAAGEARATPAIALYTMGAGDDLFSAFGHAAICVHDERSPAGRCYNYGTADFRTPVPLTWAFVRGRARFWVSVLPEPVMLDFYRREDRTVWRQVLTLPPEQATALAAALERSTEAQNRYYLYHHFNDNCTTRIRDAIDRVTGGVLGRAPVDRGRSFRQWAEQGFAGDWPLLAVAELLLGRSADRRTDSWSAMFLPSELRAEVAARLGAAPEVVYARRAPLVGGHTWLGHLAFALSGLALAALLALAARLGRRAFRGALAFAGLALGLVGLVLWALALLSTFPELTRNEALFAFWPTDLALGRLSPRLRRRYLTARLVVLALLVLGHLVGLTQPLSPLLLVALPFAVARFDPRAQAAPAVAAARASQGSS
jgi:hypothetical protein